MADIYFGIPCKTKCNSMMEATPYYKGHATLPTAEGQCTILLNMAARKFLPRCIAFYNRISIDSLKISNSSAMHLGNKFLAVIFSVIVYCNFFSSSDISNSCKFGKHLSKVKPNVVAVL